MNKQLAGCVCAAKNCKNKHYNCSKPFFRFPPDPIRARTWAINSNREDLLENVDRLYKSYRLCSDHFNSKTFTNKFCNRLKHNAIPTIFPSLEEPSKDLPIDHSYCRPKLVILEDDEVSSKDEEVPSQNISILQGLLLNPGYESAEPTKSNNNNLTMQELEPFYISDEQDVEIIEEDNNPGSHQVLSSSASTQTSPKLLCNIPRMVKYRETIRMLHTENKNLRKTIEKLENKLEIVQKDVLENITLEQYQMLTFKFCSSVEVANFINIKVAEGEKLPKGRRYSKEFKN